MCGGGGGEAMGGGCQPVLNQDPFITRISSLFKEAFFRARRDDEIEVN